MGDNSQVVLVDTELLLTLRSGVNDTQSMSLAGFETEFADSGI